MPLSDIATNQPKPPIIVLYGVAGIGKTTLAASAPSPIFIPTEEGLGKLEVPSYPVAKTSDEVLLRVQELGREEHPYKTLVIDSLSALQPLIWADCAKAEGLGSFADFAYGKGYALANDRWSRLVRGLHWLRDRTGMAAILVAHSVVEKYSNPHTDPYDRFNVRLHETGDGRGGARPTIFDAADAVLFADYAINIKRTEGDFGKERVRAVGSGDRVIYTSDRPTARAKNRYGMPEQLPMTWEAISKYL